MMNRLIIFNLSIFLISFLGCNNDVLGQTYPVQVQPSVTFASTFLSDYNDPSNVNIRVYLSDVTKTNYQIRLKVKLTSDKFSAISKTGILLTLQGGQVYFLNDVELGDLFNVNNLLISSNVQTNTDNSMPEGVYTMSFEAYDATLPGDIVVSNAATDFTVFSVNRYDPPLLTTPANKQEFDVATVNQNIFFNWTPRQVVFSPKQQVKYRFRMIKVQPVDRNPYDAINTTLPATIDVKDLDFPVFIYSPADLQLEEGCVYAWQVTAYEEVTVGGVLQESSARFKNLGMSEVFTLSIKENCQPVTPFVAPKVDQNLVALQWNFDPSHKEYELAYRPLGGSIPWTPVSTVNNLYNLDNTVLQRGVQYEYTVRAKCKNWLEPSYGGTFTLPDATCNAPEPVMVDNTSDDTKLSWTAVNGVSAYRFQYRNLSDATYTTVDLDNTTTTYSLPKLTSGGYKIKVDGVCGTDVAEGTPNDIAFDETGLVGPCPIPVPFQLIATRTQGTQAQLSWPLSTAHTGYSITYWHRDSVDVKRTLTSNDPKVLADFVYDDQLYNYQITFICDTKNTTTPVGMFRVEGTAGGVLKDPTTGNCFPPAVVQGEPRSTTSALFEWSKVDGVDGYQLMYSVKGENKFVPFNTISTSEVIKNLKDSEKYQFVVLSRCGSKYSIPSDTGMVDLAGGKSNADCDSASYFISTGQTTTNIRLCWPYVAGNTGYKLTYREEAQSPADEYTEAFTDIDAFKHDHLSQTGDTLKYTLDNLKAGTPYIFKLQVLCSSGDALRNAPLKVSTMPDTKSSGECGKDQSCDKTNVTPLPSLAPGDSIHCADYGILIDKVTASDPATGTYSGSGFMNMPMPGLSDFVRMSVSFVNVKINAQPNSCIYDGTINIDSINASVLPIELRDKVKQIEGQIDDAITNAQNALDQAQQGIDAAQQAVQTATDYFQGGDSVGNVQDGGLGEATTTQTITLPATATVNGTTATIGGTTLNSLPGLIKDGTGNVFQVGPDGTVKHVGEYDPTLAGDPTLDLADGRVVYSENSTAKYDFDEWKSMYAGITQIEREYEKISTDYHVPAKLILPGQMDPVNATVQGGDYDNSKIKFANGKGMVYDQTLSGNTFTINIAGGPAADGQYIYAWFIDGSTKKAIGKLLVPSYAPQQKKVIVIPMSKSVVDATKLQEGLNQAYAKLGITYTVTLDQSFRWNKSWDLDGDTLVQASGSKLLSTEYKGEEAEMISKYVEFKGGESAIDPQTAYFFAIYEASKLEDNLLGKMPPEEQFGFLYVGGATPSAIQRTIAHEVGHGAYHLEHSFHNIYLGANSKTHTNNLMDYSDGYELWKYQWDIIHDPGHVWGILKADKDAQEQHVSLITLTSDMLNDDNSTFSFSLSTGKVITLDKKFKIKSFTVGQSFDNFDGTKSYGDLVSFVEEVVVSGKTTYVEYFIKYYNSKWGLYKGTLAQNTDKSNPMDASTVAVVDYSKDYLVDIAKSGAPSYVIKVLPSDNGKLSLYKFKISDDKFWDESNQYQIQNILDARTAPYLPIKKITRKLFVDWPQVASQPILFSAEATKTLWGVDYNDIINLDFNQPQVLSQWYISKLKNIYPELFPLFTKHYMEWGTASYNVVKYAELYQQYDILSQLNQRVLSYWYNQVTDEEFDFSAFGVFDIKYNAYPDIQSYYTNDKFVFYMYFVQEFEDFLETQRNSVKSTLATVTDATSRAELLKVLKIANDEDIRALNVHKRITIISTLCTGTLWDGQEDYIIKLLDILPMAPKSFSVADSLIDSLRADYRYDKTITLYKRLTQNGSGMDDETLFKGNDNYRKFIATLIKLSFTSSSYRAKLDNLKSLDFQGISKQIVEFKYYSFYSRLWDQIVNAFSYGGVYYFKPAQVQTAVSVNGNVVSVSHRHYNGFIPYVWNNDVPATFDCFEPVILINQTGLANTNGIGMNPSDYEGIQNDKTKLKDKLCTEIFPVPALALEYLDDKSDDALTNDLVNTVIDVATIWTGYGPLVRSVTAWRRVLAFSDVAGSVINLSGNLYADNSSLSAEDKQMVKNVTSILSGVVGAPASLEVFTPNSVLSEELFATLKNSTNSTQLDWVKVREYLTQVEQVANASATKQLMSNSYKQINIDVLFELENSLAAANTADLLSLSQDVKKVRLALESAKSVTAIEASVFNFIEAVNHATTTANRTIVQSFATLESAKKVIVEKVNDVWNVFYYPDGFTERTRLGTIMNEASDTKFVPDVKDDLLNSSATHIEEPLSNGASAIVCKDGNCCVKDNECFVAGTQIFTGSGYKAIEQIKVGDKVSSYDSNTGIPTIQTVKKVFKKVTEKLCRLVFDQDTLLATPDHPFLTDKGWTPASSLLKGGRIKLLTGSFAILLSSTAIDTTATVYNFEVDSTHNYCVGQEKLIVHNDCIFFNYLEDEVKMPSADLNTFKTLFKFQPDLIEEFKKNPNLVTAWRELNTAGKDFAKADMTSIKAYSSLNTDAKQIALTYTDASSTSSTLIEFLHDIGQEPDFLKMVNAEPDFRRIFAGHKDQTVTSDDYRVIEEAINDGYLTGYSANSIQMAIDWKNYSEGVWKFTNYSADGIQYGKKVVDQVLSSIDVVGEANEISGGFLKKLGNYLNKNLDGYVVHKEVQLWVDKSKGQYMIADVMLLKYDQDGIIEDILILESKISSTTDYTVRQKQGWRLVNESNALEVKAVNTELPIGQNVKPVPNQLQSGTALTVNKDTGVIKISDQGDPDGSLGISKVTVSNYASYQPPKQ